MADISTDISITNAIVPKQKLFKLLKIKLEMRQLKQASLELTKSLPKTLKRNVEMCLHFKGEIRDIYLAQFW